MPVLGIIFLRHATNRYRAALREIEAYQAAAEDAKAATDGSGFPLQKS